MAKDYGGKPVYGGTYPALIWKAYVEAMLRYYNSGSTRGSHSSTAPSTPTYTPPAPSTGAATTHHASARDAVHRCERDGRAHDRHDDTRHGPTTTQGPSSTVTGGGGSTSTTPTPAALDTPRDAAQHEHRRRRRRARQRRRPVAGAQRRDTYRLRGHAEAPRQLDGARDPDPPGGDDRQQPAGAREIVTGPVRRSPPLSASSIAERLRQLARARAELLEPLASAPLAHQLDALERLERADQHPGADALAARRPR